MKSSPTIHCLLLQAVLFSGLLVASMPAMATTTVTTDQGKIVGNMSNGVYSFKGVPYALPPVGALRWQPPKPSNTGSHQLKASEFGPACLQPRRPDRPPVEMDEDCLTMNVWTPAPDSSKRPVMVWIHGGGFRVGSGNLAGEVLAAQGVVVVAMNYRLGPLGFFSHSALNNKQANFGLLDIILALQWVQTNIGKFGGDANEITIFGVSAGGMAVNMLLVSQAAEGLFHRAIAQSGYAGWALPRSRGAPQPIPMDMFMGPAKKAEMLASELVGRVIKGDQTRRMLLELDGVALVNALKGFQLPIIDGTSLREEPGILFLQGKQLDVPVITGGNSYEGSVMPASGITQADFKRSLGDDLSMARKLYQDDFNIDPARGLSRMFGDNRYLLSARVLGNSMSHVSSLAWLYYIDFVTAEQKGKYPGTPHGSDAYLLFSGHNADNEQIRALSDRLRRYWLNFARTGDPNGQGLVQWEPYDPETDGWLVFSDKDAFRPAVIQEKLDFIESRYRRRIGIPQANSRSR
jgi:para-nitrobenzyl esterase